MYEKFKKPELPPNVVRVETPEGIFRIAYGIHIRPQNPEDVKGVNAIMLETGTFNYNNPQKAIECFYDIQKYGIQYENLIKEAARSHQPIYFADVDPTTLRNLLAIFLMGVEGLVGIRLIQYLRNLGEQVLEDKNSNKNSRRDFLKLLGGGVLSTYLISPTVKVLIGLLGTLNEQTARRKVDRLLIELDEKIHPELNIIILTLRNLVMAQKLITITQDFRGEAGQKPEIAAVVGGGHIGLEKALREREENRIKIIQQILSVPGISGLRNEIANIARFDYEPKEERWKLTNFYQDSFLLQLEN
jgi:hypothetical protein